MDRVKEQGKIRIFRYVEVIDDLCNGCVLCMKACPTKAIRVRNGKARVEGICIDCFECVRACPKGALRPVTSEGPPVEKGRFSVVSASSAIYSQFGEEVMPNDVLLALRRIGFDYVHDQSYTNELFGTAIEFYIEEKRKSREAHWPLISPVCPVVSLLISHRFPSLLKHIPPLVTPREIVAREGKRRFSKKLGCSEDKISITFLSPCPAIMIDIKEPLFRENSFIDRAVGINLIFEILKENLREIEGDKILHHSGGIGLSWGVSGGEIAGLKGRCLAISGLQETIRYLQRIEMGLLQNIDYVEFRICKEGCVGGPFTVADRYEAKQRTQKMLRMFGVEKRIKQSYARELYEEGWFFVPEGAESDPAKGSEEAVSAGIERLAQVEKIVSLLPRKECGICGAPDCRSFAEDVVNGSASLGDCVLLQSGKKESAANER
jgi:iron only hydrogenase large subunit-like protein